MPTATAIANIRYSIRDTNCEIHVRCNSNYHSNDARKNKGTETHALTSTRIESHSNILGRNVRGCCQYSVPVTKRVPPVFFFEMAMSLCGIQDDENGCSCNGCTGHGDEGICDGYGQNVLPALVMETGRGSRWQNESVHGSDRKRGSNSKSDGQ